MKTENWLACHVHAFQHFGGVARLLIPDNCKTATTANTRYETVLNRSYQELAEYYGTAIVPARVRKPQDKSAAEASVRFAETWIIAALRERKFFSIREVNEAITEKLEELNNRPFQRMAGMRRSAYLEEEKQYMLPLPAMPFETAAWYVAKVPLSGIRRQKQVLCSIQLDWRKSRYPRDKACASLTKQGERYGRERLENACGRILAYSATPSIRNISSLLKNGQDQPAKAAPQDKPNDSNRFGITRGASYFRKGGDR